ncbi:MAG: hypothetical protein KC421_30060 [Anaerolineales bacterium]|nr:hypothetical protein [Anaerolineales bacterium]
MDKTIAFSYQVKLLFINIRSVLLNAIYGLVGIINGVLITLRKLISIAFNVVCNLIEIIENILITAQAWLEIENYVEIEHSLEELPSEWNDELSEFEDEYSQDWSNEFVESDLNSNQYTVIKPFKHKLTHEQMQGSCAIRGIPDIDIDPVQLSKIGEAQHV